MFIHPQISGPLQGERAGAESPEGALMRQNTDIVETAAIDTPQIQVSVCAETTNAPPPMTMEEVAVIYEGARAALLRRTRGHMANPLDGHDPEDVLQIAILKTLERAKLGKIRAPSTELVVGYIATAATRRAIDLWRHEMAFPRVLPLEAADPRSTQELEEEGSIPDIPDSPHNLSPDNAATDSVYVNDVLTLARQSLSADHYEVLALMACEGLGIPQIAERLGIPPGTAKSRIYYMREQMQEIMANPRLAKAIALYAVRKEHQAARRNDNIC
jgi:RNA polymerase sigma factor (sigma-70 family)